MHHLASPGAWQRAGMGGLVCGICWTALLALVAGHADAAQAPGIARAAEAAVLKALADQRSAEEQGRSGLLSKFGPQEPFEAVDPDAPFPFEALIG